MSVAFRFSKNVLKYCLSSQSISRSVHSLSDVMKRIEVKLEDPALDYEYLCDEKNIDSIKKNISARKGEGDIDKVVSLYKQSKMSNADQNIKQELVKEAARIPNSTHPEVFNYGTESKLVKEVGEKPSFNFEPKTLAAITVPHNLFRFEKLTNLMGPRSYYLLGNLSTLESALIRYTLSYLKENGFNLISVPDIVKKNVVQACGMNTEGERTQIFELDETLYGKDWCLSGTSEIAIAFYLKDRKFKLSELPMNFAAVSRCFRAEISRLAEEKGLYRVHQFTKVEMFSVCAPDSSDDMLNTIRSHEETLFSNLGLHYKVLDMAPHELGAQAYRKYDIEAWMPGRDKYGEISSCSNCTDYQARRLNIKCEDTFAHTLNGTACAIPRLLLALVETHQTEDGNVNIPEPLQKYTSFKTLIENPEELQKLTLTSVHTHSYKYWEGPESLRLKKKKEKKKKKN